MTNKTEHPHAWVLREIADGAPLSGFEVRRSGSIEWFDLESGHESGRFAILHGYEHWSVRRKQKMHRLGEHTFPAPMTEAPESEFVYWIATAFCAINTYWNGTDDDTFCLSAGICHTTKEAAEAHHKALAAIARGEPV